jgi:hypothetical protein
MLRSTAEVLTAEVLDEVVLLIMPEPVSSRELADLFLATSFVNEAVRALTRVLTQRPPLLTPEWWTEYQDAWRYFEAAHARYRDKATALRIHQLHSAHSIGHRRRNAGTKGGRFANVSASLPAAYTSEMGRASNESANPLA